MSTWSGPVTGVVCDDRAAERRRSSLLLAQCGITLVGEEEGFVGLLTTVLAARPRMAVVTLPLRGTSGLTAVAALRAAAPETALVLLCAFSTLDLPAQEAGAYAVLREDDPRALAAVLTELVRLSGSVGPPAPRSGEDTGAAPGAAATGSSTTKPSS